MTFPRFLVNAAVAKFIEETYKNEGWVFYYDPDPNEPAVVLSWDGTIHGCERSSVVSQGPELVPVDGTHECPQCVSLGLPSSLNSQDKVCWRCGSVPRARDGIVFGEGWGPPLDQRVEALLLKALEFDWACHLFLHEDKNRVIPVAEGGVIPFDRYSGNFITNINFRCGSPYRFGLDYIPGSSIAGFSRAGSTNDTHEAALWLMGMDKT